MPIKITDFVWSQKDLSVFINFGLRNSSPKNIDIVCTSSYLKVNFNPYIFEIFPLHQIDPEKTSSSIEEGNLHFHLKKILKKDWESLEKFVQSKKEAKVLRANALKEYEDLEKKKEKDKKESKTMLEHLAISKQISLDEEKNLQEKELLKQEQSHFFRDSSYEHLGDDSSKQNRLRLSSLCSEDGSVGVSEGDYDGDVESVNFSSSENLPGMLKKKHMSTNDLDRKKVARKGTCPSVRKSHVIRMTHTPHEPSVPKRESLASSQEEMISTIPETDAPADAFEGHETDLLRVEAAKCFGCGDFEGAIQSYEALIALCPSHASLYSNRAAALLAIHKYADAVADCSKALQLLVPATGENAKSRLLCHVRRGTCHVRMRNLGQALADFESALGLDPENVSLAKDAAVIRASLYEGTDTAEESWSSSSQEEEEEEGSEGEESPLSSCSP